jgi:C4-type Zn-finger protein
MMTQKEYIEEKGMICPNCKSRNLETVEFDYGEPNEDLTHYLECKDCVFAWAEVYKLMGYFEN